MTTKQTFFSDKAPSFDLRINKSSQPFIVGMGDSMVRENTTGVKSPQQTTLASGEKEITEGAVVQTEQAEQVGQGE